MSIWKALGWALLYNGALLLALILGVYIGAFEPVRNCGDCTPSPTTVTDAVNSRLPYVATLMALAFSWSALAQLASAGKSAASSISQALMFGWLGGASIGIAWGIGVAIGYTTSDGATYSKVSQLSLPIFYGIGGVAFTFFAAAIGAYLGLFTWLITWIARGRFRHNAK